MEVGPRLTQPSGNIATKTTTNSWRRSLTIRKKKNEKLKELKAQLNFEGCSGTSRYSESKTMSAKEHVKRYRSRRSHSPRTSVFSRIRRERSRSPIKRERSRSPRQRAKEGGVFKRLGSRGKSVFARSDSYNRHSHSRYTEALSESEDSEEKAVFNAFYTKDEQEMEIHKMRLRPSQPVRKATHTGNTFASVVKGDLVSPMSSSPALVLDDTCLEDRDYENC
nr:hypothetical protein [Tanacetum cinerariifolium]GEX13372.1 hypothetical protein [Tanacetum cinerariifolium]